MHVKNIKKFLEAYKELRQKENTIVYVVGIIRDSDNMKVMCATINKDKSIQYALNSGDNFRTMLWYNQKLLGKIEHFGNQYASFQSGSFGLKTNEDDGSEAGRIPLSTLDLDLVTREWVTNYNQRLLAQKLEE